MKIIRIMRLTIVLTVIFSVQAFATVSSQSVTLSLKEATLREALSSLRKQTSVYFVFNEEEIARQKELLTMTFVDQSLSAVLNRLLENMPFEYEYEGEVVIIKPNRQQSRQEQARTIRGRITASDGHTLPGVTVLVQGTSQGTVSDAQGNYRLAIPSSGEVKLLVSFVGMISQTIEWKGEDPLNIVMEYAETEVGEVVVTGYQVLNSRELASSTYVVAMDSIVMQGVSQVDQMLQGRIPGMAVINTSGEPSASPKIRIRGNATINSNKSPVWVVDGIILEQSVSFSAADINSDDAEYLIGSAISGINPNDIETITVLKDASATAIYGIKAANGVIVITTKKGKAGATSIRYTGNITLNTRPAYRHYDRMNSRQRMQLSKEIVESYMDYPRVPYGDSYEGLLQALYTKKLTQEEFEERVMYLQTVNTDWFKELFRAAITHNHTVSVSGGTEKTQYYFSGRYDYNQGAAVSSLSEPLNLTAKLNMKVNDWISFMTKVDVNTTRNIGYHSSINPFNYAYQRTRTLPAYDENGEYYFYDRGSGYMYNILHELKETGNESKNDRMNAQVALDVKIIKGLLYKGTFSFNTANTEQRSWATEHSYDIARFRGYNYGAYDETDNNYQTSYLPYGGIMRQQRTRQQAYTVRNTLNYITTLNEKHAINVYGGVEVRSNKYRGVAVTGYGWNPKFGEKFMPVYTNRFITGYVEGGALNPTNTSQMSQTSSFFGTATYTFSHKYVLNGNIRSDGSNKFGSDPKYRWLPTWSIAGKWILSSESFMQTVSFVDDLAIRGSYGLQGNADDHSTPNLIVSFNNRNSRSGLENYTINRLPNPELRWEKTTSWNVALDFTLFDNKVKGGFDLYRKHTVDLIMSKSVSASNGQSSLYINAGKMRNAGFEGFINMELLRTKDITWRVNVNFGRNINEITLANGDETSNLQEMKQLLAGNLAVEGAPVGSMFSFRFAGLSAENGLPLFYAKDGRKVHQGEPQLLELVNSGSIFPKLSGGFDTQLSFRRNLSLNLFFTYNLGSVSRLPVVYEDISKVFDPMMNVSTNLLKRWRQPGDEKYTNIPALYDSRLDIPVELEARREGNSFWFPTEIYDKSDERVAKADFLKLKSATLVYRVDRDLLKKWAMSDLSLTFQVANLFTIADKKWQGLDPESSGANIPLLPTYSFGLNVSF